MIPLIILNKKAINVHEVARRIVNSAIGVIFRFTWDNSEAVPYSYGSTSQVYLIKNNKDSWDVLKVYNELFCWTTKGHDSSTETFLKEVSFLERGLLCAPTLKYSCPERKFILMSYNGESLYNDFNLPEYWVPKLELIFEELSDSGIVYSEFKLQNILVKENTITFADYGLAYSKPKEIAAVLNKENFKRFVNYLQVLNDKFQIVKDRLERYQYIYTFLENVSNEEQCKNIKDF